MPTPLLSGRFPYEALFSQVMNYSLLHIFGSTYFVLLPKKIEPSLVPGLFFVCFWDIVFLKKAIVVMILSLVTFISLAMLPFSNAYLTSSFLLSLSLISKVDLVHIDKFPSGIPLDELHLSCPLRACSLFSSYSPSYWVHLFYPPWACSLFSSCSPFYSSNVFILFGRLFLHWLFTHAVNPPASEDTNHDDSQYPPMLLILLLLKTLILMTVNIPFATINR